MKPLHNFYFSEKQKQLEKSTNSLLPEDLRTVSTYFKGKEYTECRSCKSEFYSAGLLKPYNERFNDSVFIGSGTLDEVEYKKD